MPQRKAYALFLLALATYLQDVAPILNAHCIECHSVGASLILTRFPFVSTFSEDQNILVDRILVRVGNHSMPPGNRPKLTSAEIDVIYKWREQGLPY